MERDTLQLILSATAALCAAAAWHGVSLLRSSLGELKRQTDEHWSEAVDTARREYRAIGILQGGKDERADHQAELERVAVTSVLVTELPSQERRADGGE